MRETYRLTILLVRQTIRAVESGEAKSMTWAEMLAKLGDGAPVGGGGELPAPAAEAATSLVRALLEGLGLDEGRPDLGPAQPYGPFGPAVQALSHAAGEIGPYGYAALVGAAWVKPYLSYALGVLRESARRCGRVAELERAFSLAGTDADRVARRFAGGEDAELRHALAAALSYSLATGYGAWVVRDAIGAERFADAFGLLGSAVLPTEAQDCFIRQPAVREVLDQARRLPVERALFYAGPGPADEDLLDARSTATALVAVHGLGAAPADLAELLGWVGLGTDAPAAVADHAMAVVLVDKLAASTRAVLDRGWSALVTP